MKLAHIALWTNDLDAAAFWRDCFSAAIGALYRSRRQQGFTSRFTPASLRLGDILFVNAGILTDEDHTVLEVTTESFNRLMVINALSPLRTLEVLQDLVPERRTIAVISSGLGSIAENADGVWDAYSASKAALNMLMRGFASRHARKRRAIVLMAPG